MKPFLAPIACLHFYFNIQEMDHVFVELVVFVLAYFVI